MQGSSLKREPFRTLIPHKSRTKSRMAYIRKTDKGYRAEVEVQGVRKSKSFANKRDASIWAAEQESAIRTDGKTPSKSKFTLRQTLEKYRDEVAVENTGERWERLRIDAFLNNPTWLPLTKKIGDVESEDFEAFAKIRSKSVKDGTILRELGILSGVMEAARKRWKWIKENPVQDARKPKEPKARERLITPSEIRVMLRGCGYKPRAKRITTITQSIAVCFLVALRTGMRAGDMTSLSWKNVHPRHVKIEVDKVGRKKGKGRDVPLSKKAARTLLKMKGFDNDSVFALKPQTLDARFRDIRESVGLTYRDKAGEIDKEKTFTFHDSRHTAATWIAGNFKSNKDITAQQAVFDLCKIFGWTDMDRALAYYNPNPEDIASRLD